MSRACRACRRPPARAARGSGRRRGSPRARGRRRRAAAARPPARRARGTRGRCPAPSACVRSTRAQKPWMVEIQAPSAARASSRRPSSRKRARTRVLSSAAAFSVNVIARIALDRHAVLEHGLHEALDQHRASCRCPRPARTSSEPSRRVDRRALLGGELEAISPRTGRSRGRSSRRARRSVGHAAELARRACGARSRATCSRAQSSCASNSSGVERGRCRRSPSPARRTSLARPARAGALVAAERHVDAAGRLAGRAVARPPACRARPGSGSPLPAAPTL